MRAGDTLYFANGFVRFEGFNRDVQRPGFTPQPGDMVVGARLSVHTMATKPEELQPLLLSAVVRLQV